jgi:hypothetical protein
MKLNIEPKNTTKYRRQVNWCFPFAPYEFDFFRRQALSLRYLVAFSHQKLNVI